MRYLPAALLLIGGWPALATTSADVDPTAAMARAMAAAERSLAEQEAQAAESHYRAALLEGWLLLGGLEAARGDWTQAKTAFEQAMVSAAHTRRALTSLALVHQRLGEAAEAVTLLRRVVAGRPDDRRTRRLLAQALIAAGRPEEAVQELEETLAAAPDGDAETAFALASGYLRLNKVNEAESLFARVARELPGAQTQVLIGRTYRDFRLFEHARTALETALELNPAVRRGHYYLGTLELLSGGRDGLAPAIARFERELEAFPRDPMTHLYLAMALVEDRRFEEALASLDVAAGWQPTRLDALRFIGRCHLGLDRPVQAVTVLEQALALAVETAARPRQLSGIRYQLATALRRQGAHDQAAVHFAAAEEVSTEIVEGERDRFARFVDDTVDLEPTAEAVQIPVEAAVVANLDDSQRRDLERRVRTELSRAYMNLGVLDAREERFSRAAEHFRSATRLDADLPQLQRSLGAALFRAERYADAVEPLERALGQNPDGADDLRRMLALALLNTKAYDRAAALLREDPRRPRDPALQYAFGLALVRGGRAEQAEKIFGRLIAEHATWPELHVFLGQAHASQGDYASAVAALERALELEPRVAEARATLGDIYLRQGRLEKAEEALRGELAHRPDDARTRYHLAVVLDLDGRPDEARAELRTVLQTQPDLADARYLLGKIRLAQGAAEEAASHLEAAVALAPDDANVYYQLAQAYRRLGRAELASRQLERYHDLKKRQPGPGDRP